MSKELSISFSPVQAKKQDSSAKLIIEQIKWGIYTSKVTKGEIVSYLMHLLYGDIQDDTPDCGLSNEGGCTVKLLVYPFPTNLVYTFMTSYGVLSERTVSEVEVIEVVNLQLDSTIIDLKYPVTSIVSYSFVGDVYDANGSITTPPSLSDNNGVISVASPVYCSVKVKYTTIVHGYALTIIPRETAVENKYSSVVFGVWDGGTEWYVVKPPPNGDELADSTVPCGFSNGSYVIEDQEYAGPGFAQSADVVTKINYCTGEQISEEIVGG